MPIPYLILNPDGTTRQDTYPVDSFSELAGIEPEGVYTVARTYSRIRAIGLKAHIDRLEESAGLSGLSLTLDRVRLRAGLRSLLHQTGYPETRFRITIPFGEPGSVLLAAEPLKPVPDVLRREGVSTATCFISRPVPRAKLNAWLAQRKAIRESLPSGCYEGIILTEDGHLKEGLSSNIYVVLQGRLHTAEEEVLHGITRQIVLSLARHHIPVSHDLIHVRSIHNLDEAFITSSSREVLPIVRIDDIVIGSGKPGPTTVRLAREYRSWVEANLVDI